MNILFVILVLIALMLAVLVGVTVTLVLHSKQLDELEDRTHDRVFPAAAASPVPASQHVSAVTYFDTI